MPLRPLTLTFLLACLPPPGAHASPPPLPPSQDLRPRLAQRNITPRHQGNRGTCSVFTFATAIEAALTPNQPNQPRISVEFLNWSANQVCKENSDGGFFSDMWRGFTTYGHTTENNLPYTPTFDPNLKPDPSTIAHAKPSRNALTIHWIKPWDVNIGLSTPQLHAILHALAQGHPVCLGLRWPKHPAWNNGLLNTPPPQDVFDGHSILAVGYQTDPSQPGGGTLAFFNSNLPSQNGRMTWQYALSYTNDALFLTPATPTP